MAIEALNLVRFRGLHNLNLHDLRRVNLLVGGNNSGKTSLLEAIELLCLLPDVHAVAERLYYQRASTRMLESTVASTLRGSKSIYLEASFIQTQNELTKLYFQLNEQIPILPQKLSSVDPESFQELVNTGRWNRYRWRNYVERLYPVQHTDTRRNAPPDFQSLTVETTVYTMRSGLVDLTHAPTWDLTEWYDAEHWSQFKFRIDPSDDFILRLHSKRSSRRGTIPS